MVNRREKDGANLTPRKDPQADRTATNISNRKLWCFRLIIVIALPAFFLGLTEFGLRMFGFGYSTDFLQSSTKDGRKVFVQNNQFGWRFFGRQLARLPHPFSIADPKDAGTVRVFVLGESAAKGDPRPQVGLPRMLEAILKIRYPGVQFEVVNAAMTAINSHAILSIAHDLARANGDIWVIYMGNNEVVGPFGAGTVFGGQVPPLAVIRATLALKSSRTGQLLDSVREHLKKTPLGGSEWGGMQMFLDQQVRADDSRMNATYQHFARNLAEIVRTGRSHGAGVVVSTVAVNLKDCAPFASAHRTGLSETDIAKWSELYSLGIKAQAAGQPQEAEARFQEAAHLDDSFAELRFRQGQCLLALRKIPEAQQHFRAARDLDTLRFRCDGRLNGVTRQFATNGLPQRVLLADAEHAFEEHSADGLPGEEFFYEHVHLTFQGTYLLARTIAEQVEKLMPARVAAPGGASQPWPSAADCARRLGWSDWELLVAWKGILPRLNNPPFVGQFDHEVRMEQIRAILGRLAPAAQAEGIRKALLTSEEALTEAPTDAALYSQVASLRKAAGDLPGAAAASQRYVELLPSDPEGWSQLGLIRTRERKLEEASAAFEWAIKLDPMDALALEGHAQALALLGRRDIAVREFHRVLAMKPNLALAWLHLGQTLNHIERKTEADDCFRKALTARNRNQAAMVELAGFCQDKGWFEAAAEKYLEALTLDPSNAELHVGAAQNLAALQRYPEAGRHSAEAVRLAPAFAHAHLLHGTVLGQQGRLAEATDEFRGALRLKPELVEARLNLGLALMNQGQASEAVKEFKLVLEQDPANSRARKYLQELRAGIGPTLPQ